MPGKAEKAHADALSAFDALDPRGAYDLIAL
jgi:hypothetical protein